MACFWSLVGEATARPKVAYQPGRAVPAPVVETRAPAPSSMQAAKASSVLGAQAETMSGGPGRSRPALVDAGLGYCGNHYWVGVGRRWFNAEAARKKILASTRASPLSNRFLHGISHRSIGRKGASCARIKHIFTCRSQRLMHAL
jgi:hypothetical protein